VTCLEAEQTGDHADGHHVFGQRQLDFVFGDISQWHGVRAVAIALWGTQLGRVVDQDSARTQLVDRILERLLIEGQQHIDMIAAGAQALLAEADLVEAVAALDLGGRDRVGQDVIASASGRLGDHLAGNENALASFTGDADDEVFACHELRSHLLGWPGPQSAAARVLWREAVQRTHP
jgi:hypothetical protein